VERLLHRVAHDFLAHLESVVALDQLERHLSGPKSLHPDRARELLQARGDLGLDLDDRHRDSDVALERARRVLDCLLHRSFSLLEFPGEGPGTVGGSDLVHKEGLDPPCLSALEPKSSASTNSATFAVAELYPKTPPSPSADKAAAARYNPENS